MGMRNRDAIMNDVIGSFNPSNPKGETFTAVCGILEAVLDIRDLAYYGSLINGAKTAQEKAGFSKDKLKTIADVLYRLVGEKSYSKT
jgi:hypothetical protein